jgi:hypothetical protein
VRASLPKPHGKFSHMVDFKKDAITIHEAQVPQITPTYSIFSPSPERILDFVRRNCHYMPMMRFVLQDRKGNIFQTERYCFRGSIDDWIPVGSPGLLPSLTKKYLVHLGKDSFYELF